MTNNFRGGSSSRASPARTSMDAAPPEIWDTTRRRLTMAWQAKRVLPASQLEGAASSAPKPVFAKSRNDLSGELGRRRYLIIDVDASAFSTECPSNKTDKCST